MKKLIRTAAVAVSGAALLATSVVPAFAHDTSVKISGNGWGSDNKVELDFEHILNITQENKADIDNDIDVFTNTGLNFVHGNTGGDVSIETGDATSTVAVVNQANQNVLDLNGALKPGSVKVEISGNGAKSDNSVEIKETSETNITQSNEADIDNDIKVVTNTGGNVVSGNTGDSDKHDWKKNFDQNNDDGDVHISTGDAESTVYVKNSVNSNWISF